MRMFVDHPEDANFSESCPILLQSTLVFSLMSFRCSVLLTFTSFQKFKCSIYISIFIGPALEKLLLEMILLKAILTYVKEKITKLGDSIHHPGSMLVEISFFFSV